VASNVYGDVDDVEFDDRSVVVAYAVTVIVSLNHHVRDCVPPTTAPMIVC
jgi:hypothetical protein